MFVENESSVKRCSKCHKILPLSCFHRSISQKSGYRSQCSECRKPADVAWRNKNRDKFTAYSRKHREKAMSDPEWNIRRMLTHVRSRARSRGIEFGLEASDITIPDKCPVLGIPLISKVGKGHINRNDSPSIDRIDSTKGYVKGNVIVVSWRANHVKSDATIDDLQKLVDYYSGL